MQQSLYLRLLNRSICKSLLNTKIMRSNNQTIQPFSISDLVNMNQNDVDKLKLGLNDLILISILSNH